MCELRDGHDNRQNFDWIYFNSRLGCSKMLSISSIRGLLICDEKRQGGNVLKYLFQGAQDYISGSKDAEDDIDDLK